LNIKILIISFYGEAQQRRPERSSEEALAA